MFSHHVTRELSAYCNGELKAADASRVAEHLIGCQRCRNEYETVKLGVSLAERLPTVAAPENLWRQIQSRSMNRHAEQRSRKRNWRPVFATTVATVVVAVSAISFWWYRRETRPFWQVARVNGSPLIGNKRIDENGRLAVGDWLETDGQSRARINVGTIGEVEVDPNTRVRLLETKPTEHRLELVRGRMSAQIWAPPRLFFVDTPSAVAADLGCAYTLEVDEEGAGLLHVTSGWVALQLNDRESIVPAGAACVTRPGVGPGTPYFEDSSAIFRDALARFDVDRDDLTYSKIPLLELLLLEARQRDTLTLWHLLPKVEGADRERVFNRMVALTPLPPGVTREGVLKLDEQTLQLWKDDLERVWTNSSTLKRSWIDVWTKTLGKVKGMQGRK